MLFSSCSDSINPLGVFFRLLVKYQISIHQAISVENAPDLERWPGRKYDFDTQLLTHMEVPYKINITA
jgi:hypothetical protein